MGVSADIQTALDTTGYLPSGLGTVALDAPIFVPSGSRVKDAKFNQTSKPCPAFILGHPRGLIPDSFYSSSTGFRTHGVCHLAVTGSGELSKWSSYTGTVRIWFYVVKHDGSWGLTGGVALAGIQETGTGVYGPMPRPWLLMPGYQGDKFMVSIRLTDNIVRVFTLPMNVNAATLDGYVDIDLANNEVRLKLNGVETAMTEVNAVPWPAVPRLIDNYDYPIGLGRFSVRMNGHWGSESRPDISYHNLKIEHIGATTSLIGMLHPKSPRPTTRLDTGGNPIPEFSLPLVPWQHGSYAVVVHESESEINAAAGDVLFDSISISAGSSASLVSLIWIGAALGPVRFDNLRCGNAWRGVHHTRHSVAYKLIFTNYNTQWIGDTSASLHTSFGVLFDGCYLYGGGTARCGLDLQGCLGIVRGNTFVTPGDNMEGMILQTGGEMTYDGVIGNFEWPTDVHALAVRPSGTSSHDQDTVINISGKLWNGRDPKQQVRLLPSPSNYTGKLVVNGVSMKV